MRYTAAAPLVLALVLSAGLASAARVLYVASNGIDSIACGPVSRPCLSIGQAVVNANPGDRIVVGPGTYAGFVLVKAVALESTHGAGATVIDGTGNVVDVQPGADGAVIGRPSKGFTIRGGDAAIAVSAADVVIEDDILASLIGVSATNTASRLTVTGSVITGTNLGVALRGEGSAIVQSVIQGNVQSLGVSFVGEHSVISDTVITGAATGVRLRAAAGTVRRSTFAANAIGVHIFAAGFDADRVVTSNNFLGNTCAVQDDSGLGVVVTGNYWGRASGPGPDPADNVCGFPMTTTPFLRAPVTIGAPAGR